MSANAAFKSGGGQKRMHLARARLQEDDASQSKRIRGNWTRLTWYGFPRGTAVVIYKWPKKKKGKASDKREEEEEEEEEKGRKKAFERPVEIVDCHGKADQLAAAHYFLYQDEAKQVEALFADPPFAMAHGFAYSGFFESAFLWRKHYFSAERMERFLAATQPAAARAERKKKKKKKKEQERRKNQEQQAPMAPMAPMPGEVPMLSSPEAQRLIQEQLDKEHAEAQKRMQANKEKKEKEEAEEMADLVYRKPERLARLVAVRCTEEEMTFHSQMTPFRNRYIIFLKKGKYRMMMVLGYASHWDRNFTNKYDCWLVFERLVQSYEGDALKNSTGDEKDEEEEEEGEAVKQQRMLQWGTGSAHTSLTVPTDVAFGKADADSQYDQLLGMAASSTHTLFRTAFGKVYAFGSNAYGQLGIGDRSARSQATLLGDLSAKVTHLECGSNFTVAGDTNGNVYVWGSIAYGQIGLDPDVVETIKNEVISRQTRMEEQRRRKIREEHNKKLMTQPDPKKAPFPPEPGQAPMPGAAPMPGQAPMAPMAPMVALTPAPAVEEEEEKVSAVSGAHASEDVMKSAQQEPADNSNFAGAVTSLDDEEDEKKGEDADGESKAQEEEEDDEFFGVKDPQMLRLLKALAFGRSAEAHCVCLPVKLKSMERIKVRSISAGSHHCLMLDEQDSVWCLGRNNMGQCAIGEVGWTPNPMRVGGLPSEPIAEVAANVNHSLFLTAGGKIYACGSNYNGSLGFPEEPLVIAEPRMVPIEASITQISSGSAHHAALADDGRAYLWGSNPCGQCNRRCELPKHQVVPNPDYCDEKGNLEAVPGTLSKDHVRALRRKLRKDRIEVRRAELERTRPKGKFEDLLTKRVGYRNEKRRIEALENAIADELGAQPPTPEEQFYIDLENQEGVTTFSKVVAGKSHTLFLTTDGKVYACGQDTYGQLGHVAEERSGVQWRLVPVHIENRIYDIAACGDQSFAVEGLSSSRLGQTLWQAYQQAVEGESGKEKPDLVLELRDGSQHQAHRSVLCARIPFFGALLELAASAPVAPPENVASAGDDGLDADDGGLDDDDDDDDFGGLDSDDDEKGAGGLAAPGKKFVLKLEVLKAPPGQEEVVEMLSNRLMKRLLEYAYSGAIMNFTLWDKENAKTVLKVASELNLERLAQIYGAKSAGGSDVRDTLVADMESLFQRKTHADVTFLFADGTKVPAHKFVITSRSEYFAAMLSGAHTMHEGRTGEITMPPEVTPSVFLAFLHFLYTDTLMEGLDLGQLVMLWGLCHQYRELALFDVVESTIIKRIDRFNVFECLKAAAFYNAKKLQRYCVQTIATEFWDEAWDPEDPKCPLAQLSPPLLKEVRKAHALEQMGIRDETQKREMKEKKSRFASRLKAMFQRRGKQ